MRRLLLLPLLFSLLLIGCGGKHHYPAALLMADSLCDVNPKAAIDNLDRLAEQMTQAPEADRMYYRLLCIKAADKAYIPHTSDSLIRTVLDYYEHGGDPQLLPTAYYYGGRVNMDLGDAPQAIGYYRKALDAMPHDSTTARLRGLCHNQMGHLYISLDLNEEGLREYQQAKKCFEEIGDTMRSIYALSGISSAYNFLNERERALDTLKVALRLMEESKSTPIQPNVLNQLARTYHHLHQPDSARKYIQQALHHLTPGTRTTSFTIACYIYKDVVPKDSLIWCAQRLLEEGNLNNIRYAHRRLAEHEVQNGNLPQAIAHYQKWVEMNDSVEDVTPTETVARMQSVYNYQLREKENTRLKEESLRRRNLVVFLLSLVLLLSASIFFLYKYNRRKKEALQLKIEKYEHIVKEKKQQKGLNPEKYLEWQSLLRKMVEEKKHMNEETWKSFSSFFEENFPYFHDECMKLTKMSRINYQLCMLIKMGLCTEELSVLLVKTYKAIHSMKTRLYRKTFGKEGKSGDWDNIICSL